MAEQYKPEVNADFARDVFTGAKLPCKVNSCIIEDVAGGTNQKTGEDYEGYTRVSYEIEVVDGEHKGRRDWRKYNLDNKVPSGKKNLTPIQKLNNAFFTVGLEFELDVEGNYGPASLSMAIDKFVDLPLLVSFSKFKGDDGMDVQWHTIVGIAEGVELPKEEKRSF